MRKLFRALLPALCFCLPNVAAAQVAALMAVLA